MSENKKTGKITKLLEQFVKFGMVGVLNTLISTGIYYIFIFVNEDLYLIGHIVGFIVSVLNAYYFNQKFVFKLQMSTFREHLKALLKTYLSYGFTFLLSTFLLWFFVEICDISEKIVPFINLLITTPLNFIFNKFWSFKKK
ncbi:MAG: GtrA family protein [Ruminococcus sp.]|nr:GtrA family protein [Ruminococcus sp.]